MKEEEGGNGKERKNCEKSVAYAPPSPPYTRTHTYTHTHTEKMLSLMVNSTAFA